MVNFITSEEMLFAKIKFIPFRKQVLQGGGGEIPTLSTLIAYSKKGKNHLKK